MAKMVIYNGGTKSCERCSDPKVLRKGKAYEVIVQADFSSGRMYYLRGINGEFDSRLFYELPKIYLTISTEVPIEGTQMTNFQRVEKDRMVQVKRSATIKKVTKVEMDMYFVHTENRVYMVQVV